MGKVTQDMLSIEEHFSEFEIVLWTIDGKAVVLGSFLRIEAASAHLETIKAALESWG